jgi:hypothetical protein
MADIKNIINELLLELSVTYPFPNMKDREQVFALLNICEELGYGYLKPTLEEMFLNEAEGEGESKLFPGKFHLGGGFYSSKNGGEAELKNEKGNLRPVTPEEKAKFDAKNGKGEQPQPTDEPKKDEPTAEKPADKPEEPTTDKPSAEQPQQQAPPQVNPEAEQGKRDAKEDPQKVLSDPKASAQSKAMARAFKAQNDIDTANAEDKPEEGDIKTKSETVSTELKNRKSEDGEDLDVETTEKGSLLIGVEHGEGTESTKQTIEQIKTLPKNTKVMFVGEGGMSRDEEGNLDLSGEQAEIRDAVKGHFDNAEESSWDENANVFDDNSPVYDEVAKTLGGSKSKAKAAIWSNMYGQDGTDSGMDADDYLDEEGKQWLIDQAKKGGSSEFDGVVDWNNLSEEQKNDLYELNYRDDEGYGETEISKAQQSYNGFRQKELDKKIKEAEDNGFTVIAPVGNSHVDLWRKRNKKNEFKPIEADEVSNEMPKADKEIFKSDGEALSGIQPAQLEQFNTDINKVAKMIADAEAKGEPAPDINLCDITIPGTNLYCDDNKGIPREEMPQFKGKAVEGSRAAGMEADKDGEVDTEPIFREMLKQKNIKVLQTEVPADKLKATQKDLVGGKVIGMMGALEKDPTNPKITAPIYVSRDGYVIDGHHRWAAIVAYNAKHPEAPIEMKSTVIDMDIKDAIPMANKFAEDMGIAAKKADVKDGEAPTEEPKVTDDKVGTKATTDSGKKLYHIGNGYYSDSPNGDAKYIRVESVVERAIETDSKKWWSLLFEVNIKAKVDGGGEGLFKEIPKDEIEVATDAAKQSSDGGGNTDVSTAKANLKISDKVIQSNIAKAETHIDNSEADDSTKQILKDTVSKILKGEDVDPTNLEIASKWLAIRVGGGNDIGMYIAKTEGDFNSNSREKIQMDIPKGVENSNAKADEWNDSMVNKYGLPIRTQTGAFVNKKDWTAAKMNENRRKVKFETSENSVTVDGITYTKRPIPEQKTLVEQKTLAEQFIKQGKSEAEAIEDARKIIASIERGNNMVDNLSKMGEMEVVEYGPTDTDENRKKTLKNTIDTTRKSVLESIRRYSGLSDEEIKIKYADLLNSIDEIEKSAPINNPNWDSMSSEEKQKVSDEYTNKLVSVLENIRRDSDIASGGPDIAEVLVFMKEIGTGNQAFLPSSSNFPTVDIVSFNQQKTPPENATPEELAEFYANEYSANSISFIDSDAESIKLGKGGASAGHKKSQESTFGNEKTGEVLDSLMDCYNGTFGDYPPSKEAIDKAEESYNEAGKHLTKILIEKGYSPQQVERMIADMERRGMAHYEQAKKSYEKSLNGEPMDPEFDRGLRLYNMAGSLFEMMFNEDVKSNNFGNVRFIESGKGKRTKISMEVLDGINEKCCVKFNPNPGELKIKGDESGKRKAAINVSFSTWITKCKK